MKIDLYNSIGNKITTLVDEFKEEGKHHAEFKAEGLPQGMYFYTVQIGERRESGKVILVR
ncbi:MAG: T9SS type A sorting domain-containing protein [Bacteroidetes bacterium]|nr:T9SS type A sorting domain-containing protein [Bacteroidota bacterium]